MFLSFVLILVLLSGDIKLNPGPVFGTHNCLSIVHQNIRSLANKVSYVTENLLDFDVICFTKTHLNIDVNEILSNLDG